MKLENFATSGIVIVVVHLIVSALHGLAHLVIPVSLPLLSALYVGIVIGCMPLIAVWELSKKHYSRGAWLLFLSMLGSLLFGIYNHFIAISPDHVSHVPDHDATPLFQVTAYTIMVLEAIGTGIGLWGINLLPRMRYGQS